MEMKGEQEVPLSRDKAWEALNDPTVLEACIPGCESMEQAGENEFKARVRTAVGPVNAQFKGKVKLSDMNPPESYKMTFKGDGTAGFAQGSADIRLSPTESGQGTLVSYEAQAKVGGKLAQIGSRLIDGAARKMANEFFANLAEHMGATPAPEPVEKQREQPTSARQAGGIMAAIRRLWAKLFG